MTEEKNQRCPECFGLTIQFRGEGKDMQYKICSRYKESGHKTKEEIEQIIRSVRMATNPSGRLA